MPQHFYAFQSYSLDHASARVALSAAAKCADERGSTQCIVVVGADKRMLAHALSAGDDAPSIERMLDRARRAAALSIEIDGIGAEHGPELAAYQQPAEPHVTTALTICRQGQLLGAIGVTSEGDAGNREVAQAGRSALLQLFAGGNA